MTVGWLTGARQRATRSTGRRSRGELPPVGLWRRHPRRPRLGHGRGMSKWGARGGATWSSILSTYFPGTTQQSRGGRIRVKVSITDFDQVKVSKSVSLIVRPIGAGTLIWRDSTVHAYRLVSNGGTMRLGTYDGTAHTVAPGAEALTLPVSFDRPRCRRDDRRCQVGRR